MKYLWAALVAAALVACGGGGGSSSQTPSFTDTTLSTNSHGGVTPHVVVCDTSPAVSSSGSVNALWSGGFTLDQGAPHGLIHVCTNAQTVWAAPTPLVVGQAVKVDGNGSVSASITATCVYDSTHSCTTSKPAHVIAGLTIFTPGSTPFNNDISSETATGTYTCHGGTPCGFFKTTQSYVLHIDSNTPNELETVGICCGTSHTTPDMPLSSYASLSAAVGNAGDHAFEVVDPSHEKAYDVYNLNGSPGAWAAYSGCIDTVNGTTNENLNNGPCNSSTGWHDVAIAGGLTPEEVTGVWAQPNGTINHALVVEEPGCGGAPCGIGRIRLKSSIAKPSDPQAAKVWEALRHYGAWTTEGGGYLTWPRLFVPQNGDSNFDSTVTSFLVGLQASDFEMVP